MRTCSFSVLAVKDRNKMVSSLGRGVAETSEHSYAEIRTHKGWIKHRENGSCWEGRDEKEGAEKGRRLESGLQGRASVP